MSVGILTYCNARNGAIFAVITVHYCGYWYGHPYPTWQLSFLYSQRVFQRHAKTVQCDNMTNSTHKPSIRKVPTCETCVRTSLKSRSNKYNKSKQIDGQLTNKCTCCLTKGIRKW